MGPGLILVHSQGKWMQRLTRQQCCLKKALTISWKKSSLKAVSLPIIPGHRLHCPGNWELWASEVHPLYPQGPFLKWQNFRRILQSFMCATVETMLCVCFFFPENTCVLLFHGLTWHQVPSSFAHQISLNYMLLLLLQANARDLQLTVGWFKP